ncbi:MAG: acetolactate synthase [Lachnospiraceae bacterium]|nr:acetolactate synthase [Lachnospiraceae bacterium]
MTTKQISIFMENRPGSLYELCKALEEENINMRAMCLAEAEDFGICRIIVDEPLTAATALRDHGYICKITKVLTIEIEDKAGALVGILNQLGSMGINLEYAYAFLSKKPDKAYMVLRVLHPETAVEKLQGSNIRLICQDELEELFED